MTTTKKSIFAILGLAVALTLAVPTRAHAGVIVGVGVGIGPVGRTVVVGGPVFVPRPAYGYVAWHPGPYYYGHPYAYGPRYVYPRGYYRGYVGSRPWHGYGYRGYYGPR
jgi:hypothetical protein